MAFAKFGTSVVWVMKLYKGIGGSQLSDGDINGSILPSENDPINSGKQVAVYSHPLQTMSQSGTYQESWIKDIPSKQESYSWARSVLNLNSLNQSPGSVSEWYSDGPTIQRPVRKQRNSEVDPNCTVDQHIYGYNSDANHVASRSSVYQLLVARAQQDLLRSTDSSLYSDPEGQRPFSSESSGSTRSSFSISNLDRSTSSNSTGSTSASWDQSLLNEMMDSGYSDNTSQSLIRDNRACQYSPQYPSWQTEEQSTPYLSSDFNNNKLGIWSSRFQSQEDHELIDHLFMKEDRSSRAQRECYGNINLSLSSLSLSNSHPSNDSSFARAIQPPLSSYSRGKINTSS